MSDVWVHYLFYFIFSFLVGNVSGIVVVSKLYYIATLGSCGTYSLMIGYVTTAIASLFFAKKLVDSLGATLALFLSCVTYVISAAALAMSTYDSSLKWYLMMPASVGSGFGDAMWYTATGVLLAEFSYLTSPSGNANELNETRSTLSSITTILEFVLGGLYQVASSEYLYYYSQLSLFTSGAILMAIFALLASSVAASYEIIVAHQGVVHVASLDAEDSDKENADVRNERRTLIDVLHDTSSPINSDEDAKATFEFAFNKVMWLSVPALLAYCMVSVMVNVYINAVVIVNSSTLGINDIGWLSAISRVAGILVNPLLSYYCSWRHEIVVFCCVLCCLCGIVIEVVSESTLGTQVYLIPFLIVFGVIRAVYSNTLSVIFVEFFEFDVSGAFSYRNFLISVFFTSMYGVYTYVSVAVMSWSIIICGSCASYSYWLAFSEHRRLLIRIEDIEDYSEV